jgi:tetratricopeptide (TPR) repeat protein
MIDKVLRQAHAAVKREDWVQSWLLTNHALNEDPERAEALYLMGAAQRQMGNVGLAKTLLAKALSKERGQPNLWMAYAASLHDLNQWEEAIEAFTVVHNMLPTDPMPIANIAAGYVQMGKWHDAINYANRALELDPENYIAKIAKTFGCLALGRWKDAWENAEYLYGSHLNTRVYQGEGDWDGSKGKTVIVQCDQGLGDQIMFAQCLPELQADCKEVILECAPRMVPFFTRNFPGIHVYGTSKETQVDWLDNHKIDAHVHISFLGKWYRRSDSEFPRKPYITANPRLKAKWTDWLHEYRTPHIGISWKGGIQATQTHLRSIALEDLKPVLQLPGSFIDLSYMDNGLEISQWNLENKTQVIRPPIDAKDYEDTIALVAALDEVVTVTTTVAHVCGALGRTARVLTPVVPQWRYAYKYNGGYEMLWYPANSVRLYRQVEGEDGWALAINRIAKDMK